MFAVVDNNFSLVGNTYKVRNLSFRREMNLDFGHFFRNFKFFKLHKNFGYVDLSFYFALKLYLIFPGKLMQVEQEIFCTLECLNI